MSSKKVMLGAVVGVAAGAVLGLLFAPAKGAMTRRRMARKVTDSAEDVQENLSGYVDATVEEYDSVKQGAADFVDKAKKKAVSATEKLRAR
jgi:gas vesicle protein